MINNENKILYILTRTTFTSDNENLILNTCSQVQIKWDVVFLTALQHKVLPLVYINLLKCQEVISTVPENLLKDFKSKMLTYGRLKIKKEQKIRKVLSRFNQKSVEVMFLKGAALSFTVYKNYPCYFMGDIDIILNNKRQNVSDAEDQDDIKFFQSLKLNEWERYQHHDVNMNGIIPINFSEIWERSINTDFLGERVNIMSPEDMLLTACINSCRKRFFRLKSICDIREIIYYYQELDWGKFVELTKKYDCELIVYTSLMVTHRTIGCEFPNYILDDLSIWDPRKVLIRHLISYLSDNIPLASLFFYSRQKFSNGQRGRINLFLLLKFLSYPRTISKSLGDSRVWKIGKNG